MFNTSRVIIIINANLVKAGQQTYSWIFNIKELDGFDGHHLKFAMFV